LACTCGVPNLTNTVKHGQAQANTGKHCQAQVTHGEGRTVRGPQAILHAIVRVTQARLARTVTQFDERLRMMRTPLAAHQRASRGFSCLYPFPAPLHTFDIMH